MCNGRAEFCIFLFTINSDMNISVFKFSFDDEIKRKRDPALVKSLRSTEYVTDLCRLTK